MLVQPKFLIGPAPDNSSPDTEYPKEVLNQIADMADAQTQGLRLGPTKFSVIAVD